LVRAQASFWYGADVPPASSDLVAPADADACAALMAAGERLARLVEVELQARHRIGLRALEVLDRLAAAPAGAGVRITGLLDRARLSQSRMSRLVAELEGRGLVARASCPGDARGVEVLITRSGRRTLDEARRTHMGALRDRMVARLEPDELAALGRIAARLLED
jgi:DNA-binding MarR family transcriptional regulator